MSVKVLESKVSESAVLVLEEALKKAKSGDLQNVAIVGEHRGGEVYTNYAFIDFIQLLGSLHFVMARITSDINGD